jgi:GNAT superfamily N-acetyltransferase
MPTSVDAAAPLITVRPANEATCEDLDAVFGERGSAATCRCQRYKLAPGEAFKHNPAEVRADRHRAQAACGDPRSPRTSGLVAYVDGAPAGWCAVEPRPAYFGLLRVYRVPWDGRSEDREDPGIWAVTCLLARAGYRRRGVAHALARAAVDFARDRGARALEAYPMITHPGQEIAWDEIHVGTVAMYQAAGMAEVHRASKRRVVMRIDFSGTEA